MDCRWRRSRTAAAGGRILASLVTVSLLLAGCGGKADQQLDADGGKPDALVSVHPVTYRSSYDDTEVKGLVAIPRGVESKGCVMWQFGFRSTKENTSLAWQGIAALGLTTFSIDMREHGARAKSKDSYEQVLNDPETFAKMVRGTVGDLRSAVDFLEEQPYCHKNIAYAGVSLGGAIGTIFAAKDKRVKATVLVVTPGTWRDVMRAPDSPILPGVKPDTPRFNAGVRVYSPFDPDRYVAQIAPRPVLIISGTTDQTVLLSNARKLQEAAKEPKTVYDFRGSHNPTLGPDADDVANRIGSFLLHNIVQPEYGITSRQNGTFFEQ